MATPALLVLAVVGAATVFLLWIFVKFSIERSTGSGRMRTPLLITQKESDRLHPGGPAIEFRRSTSRQAKFAA